MSLDAYSQQIIEFVRSYQAWAVPLAFVFAFGESLALAALILPGRTVFLGIGALIGSSGISVWPIWVATAIGGACGAWLSYWIGFKFKHSATQVWPLSSHPDLIPRGETLVKRWGALGVFIGRFAGPVRTVVPLAAGIFAMPFWPFQTANLASAGLWAAVYLQIGITGSQLLMGMPP